MQRYATIWCRKHNSKGNKPMQYTKLGFSGIEVSKICLGGMSFGKASPDFLLWTLDKQESEKVIGHAFLQGINFIDTANCYSFGTSEEYIASALKNLHISRDKVVLASKVHFNEGGLSASAIKREIEGTLRRLNTDYLDLYIIHRFDYDHPYEETMQVLDDLVSQGKVRALGASEMYAYQLHNYQVFAEQNSLTKFTSMQCHYSLLYREDEREMFSVCRQFDMALTPYSPLASGHLAHLGWRSDSLRSETDKTIRNKYDATQTEDEKIVQRVSEIAQNKGCKMANVALAWQFAKGIESPIVGCSSPSRVDDAVASLDVELTKDEIDYLEELYVAHELVGPKGRPGERPLRGTVKMAEAK